MKNEYCYTIDDFTIISCSVIFIAFIISLIFVCKISDENYTKHKKKVNQIPTLISTLGVLGTFLGITKGLLSFDTGNLNESIPLLLDGLKTAFFTSLEGMFGSLILNGILNRKIDKYDNLSDSEKAAKLIIKELQVNNKQLSSDLSKFTDSITENKVIEKISVDIEQLKDDVEEIKGYIEESKSIIEDINVKFDDISQSVDNVSSSSNESNSRTRAVLLTATASIASIDNNIETVSEKISEIKEKIDSQDNV